MEKNLHDFEHEHDESRANLGSDRDLGTVGGGNVTMGGNKSGRKNVNTEQAGEESVAKSDYNSGTGAPAARGDINDHTIHATAGGGDDPIAPQQGTLGGRNPGQISTTIGDQDKTFGHRSMDDKPADPMTSRAPDKINQNIDQEKAREEIKKKMGGEH